MDAITAEQLAVLQQTLGPSLVLFARQHCHWPEDVVQEAFLRLIEQQRMPANVRAWLYRVVRNAAISQARKDRRRRRHETDAARRDACWFAATDSPLDLAELQAALSTLEVPVRETIVARIWGGMSLREVAELTNTSISTAYRRYRDGLQTMRERLDVLCRPTD